MSDDRELILKLRRQISKLQSREIGHKATIKGLQRECLRLSEIAFPPQEEKTVRDEIVAAYMALGRPFKSIIIGPYRMHIDDEQKSCDNESSKPSSG